MKTTLARAAVVAATRIVEEGFPRADYRQAVRDAHLSLFDTEADESTPKALARMEAATDIAHDLALFGLAVQGGRND